jgi:hypothetical protein
MSISAAGFLNPSAPVAAAVASAAPDRFEQVDASLKVDPATVARLQALMDGAEKALHAVRSIGKTAIGCFGNVADFVIGSEAARRANGFASAPPVGVGMSTLFAGRYVLDLAKVGERTKTALGSVSNLLLNPSGESLVGAADHVGKAAQCYTRVAYLGSVLGALSFHPVLNRVNLVATGTCAFFGGLSQVKAYREAFAEKVAAMRSRDEGDMTAALHKQISCLLRIAENLSLIAFAVIGTLSAPCSMLPLTVSGGIAMAAAAGFALAAKLHDEYYAPPMGADRVQLLSR